VGEVVVWCGAAWGVDLIDLVAVHEARVELHNVFLCAAASEQCLPRFEVVYLLVAFHVLSGGGAGDEAEHRDLHQALVQVRGLGRFHLWLCGGRLLLVQA